jgi:hypothetical protein
VAWLRSNICVYKKVIFNILITFFDIFLYRFLHFLFFVKVQHFFKYVLVFV